MPSSLTELGMRLGAQAKGQDTLSENLSPDEFDSQLVTFDIYDVVVELEVTTDSLCYDTNTFVIDHPVYGDIDSATLLIDGGYGSCPSGPGAPPGSGRVGIF